MLSFRVLGLGVLVLAYSLVLPVGGSIAVAANGPPMVDEKAKDFELKSITGDKVSLSGIAEQTPVVLVVLRGFPGYQCPACNQQVVQFLEKAEKFKDAGVQVLIVYPGPARDLARHAQQLVRDKTIPDHFHLLLDPDYSFTKAYQLRWNARNETAYPATFVIQQDLQITFAKVSKSHGGRTMPDEVLKALETTAKAQSRTDATSAPAVKRRSL